MPAWHRLASAVSVPDQETVSSLPAEPTLKRKSSITDPDAKRRRLSSLSHASNDVDANSHEKENTESGPNEQERRSSVGVEITEAEAATEKPGPEKDQGREQKQRRGGRRDEERKRGQRLFGALLGTLSQSSNSTAQKRRADIERRQQDKLKLQDEEYDELKKKRREERLVIRKKEQKLYEEEAVGFFFFFPHWRCCIWNTDGCLLFSDAHPAFEFVSNGSFSKDQDRAGIGMYHDNSAHRNGTCPDSDVSRSQYYKPWELRREDEDIIQDQIEDAEKTVAREVAEFEARYPPPQQTEGQNPPETKPKPQAGQEVEEDKPADHPAPVAEVESERKNETREPQETTHEASDRVGVETKRDQSSVEDPHTRTNHEPQPDPSEADHPDDGGEVVEEDNEDTVIY